jgi:hypothetical protein
MRTPTELILLLNNIDYKTEAEYYYVVVQRERILKGKPLWDDLR